MRDHDPRTVRQLIAALHRVEDELREARCMADYERLAALIEGKRSILHELGRRRFRRSALAWSHHLV